MKTDKDWLNIPDETAIQAVIAGHSKAFEIIMRRYNQQLYRIARSILRDSDAAQDAMQQAYITAYYALGTFSPRGSFGAWLTRITINEALMMKRKPDNRLSSKLHSIDNDRIAVTNDNPAVHYANHELAGLIETAIEKLPDEFRYVFVLRSVQRLSTRETAACLDLQEATVKTRLHRARHLMQHALSPYIEKAGMHVYEFAGQRCDNMVKIVLEKVAATNRFPSTNACPEPDLTIQTQ